MGERGRSRRSRAERQQRTWQTAEEVGFGTCRGERKANAARGLDDAGGDFQETKTQRRELGSGQFLDFGDGVGKHPVRTAGSTRPRGMPAADHGASIAAVGFQFQGRS